MHFAKLRFIVNLFHVFYQYRGEEYRSLYRAHFYLEVRYIEVILLFVSIKTICELDM